MDSQEKKLLLELFAHVIKERPQLLEPFRTLISTNEGWPADLLSWKSRGYAPPSPQSVKLQCLLRYAPADCAWIETGTYLGATTEFLAAAGGRVITIEPEPKLFNAAVERLRGFPNVTVLNGTSESCLPEAIASVNGNIAFWLDGHYSEGITFQGVRDTPIIFELDAISSNISRLGKVSVLVDDVRCFRTRHSGYANYPLVTYLIDWANNNDFDWSIEHDIFCAIRH